MTDFLPDMSLLFNFKAKANIILLQVKIHNIIFPNKHPCEPNS